MKIIDEIKSKFNKESYKVTKEDIGIEQYPLDENEHPLISACPADQDKVNCNLINELREAQKELDLLDKDTKPIMGMECLYNSNYMIGISVNEEFINKHCKNDKFDEYTYDLIIRSINAKKKKPPLEKKIQSLKEQLGIK